MLALGQRFGRLVVESHAPTKNYFRMVNVRCDCGKTKEIRECSLTTAKIPTRSCGCLQKEAQARTMTIHGMTTGMSKGAKPHPAFNSWHTMIQRCMNPKNDGYHNYGGRGITVCEAWKSFSGFWKDMEKGWFPGGTLERDDVNGNYEPGNVRWATRQEQYKNMRKNHEKMRRVAMAKGLRAQGLLIREIAEFLKVTKPTVHQYLNL